MSIMYSEIERDSNSHIPLSDGGGGGWAFSTSVKPPTGSRSRNFLQKHPL